ncbi:unnamed protein product [Arctogadus glacialis]
MMDGLKSPTHKRLHTDDECLCCGDLLPPDIGVPHILGRPLTLCYHVRGFPALVNRDVLEPFFQVLKITLEETAKTTGTQWAAIHRV